MKTITIKTISTYKNGGERAEQNLAYTLLGEVRTHDSVPFDIDSDIPELHMSVKASHFTLVSGKLMTATTREGQIAEYMARTASTCVGYVTEENIAYIMDMAEFEAFLLTFSRFEKESSKNGGCYKVRFPAETAKVRAWLAERA